MGTGGLGEFAIVSGTEENQSLYSPFLDCMRSIQRTSGLKIESAVFLSRISQRSQGKVGGINTKGSDGVSCGAIRKERPRQMGCTKALGYRLSGELNQSKTNVARTEWLGKGRTEPSAVGGVRDKLEAKLIPSPNRQTSRRTLWLTR